MAMLGRFLLRLLLVPLGAIVASIVATLVVLIGNGVRVLAMIKADPTATGNVGTDIIMLGPAVVLIFGIGAFILMMGGVVSILISEIFALRSWLFHTLSGGVWMWLGWRMSEEFRKPYEFFNDPVLVTGAGIAAGLTYWLIAGWSAGFWKPVFRSTTSPPLMPPPVAPPPVAPA